MMIIVNFLVTIGKTSKHCVDILSHIYYNERNESKL